MPITLYILLLISVLIAFTPLSINTIIYQVSFPPADCHKNITFAITVNKTFLL
ncbi:hypothetical protein DAQ1742_03561 [Dickeya aquatica]|uniref:Uncharacterized protein n=1 Tax=Dickeya aquatica TaxID=1401087 RepID=A0A375AE36_9GAMM|nr:hypothetical protein DAQ1742_03561 [Dickeya aquatica]